MVETMLKLEDKSRNIEFCFEHLAHTVLLAREKMDKETVSNSERRGWARLLVMAITTYGRLLEGKELGEILDILDRKAGALHE